MDIVSYRGPSRAGGVSGALSQVLQRSQGSNQRWWSLTQNALMLRDEDSEQYVCSINKQLFDAHYRYCNNFLWPVMHELPQFTRLDDADRFCYQQFNLALAANIRDNEQLPQTDYFIQDYQLALVPGLLQRLQGPGSTCLLFWHIPWPKNISSEHIEPIVEIAASLLSSRKLGFHIEEYANNFMNFVALYMPEYAIDTISRQVQSVSENASTVHTCEIIVHPIGLDLRHWEQALGAHNDLERKRIVREVVRGPFVLSVDRADYTKGVIERLGAIDTLFQRNPHLRSQLTFLQLCQRTREGLPAFDKYWSDCMDLAAAINRKWGSDNWNPIVWVPESLNSSQLAAFYESANIMLVNPLRDGLNLTAKEFVACSGAHAGVLLLSSGAGVWHELSESVVEVRPFDHEQFHQAIKEALKLSQSDRANRLTNMRRSLKQNTLQNWWRSFSGDQIFRRSILHNRENALLRKRLEEVARTAT